MIKKNADWLIEMMKKYTKMNRGVQRLLSKAYMSIYCLCSIHITYVIVDIYVARILPRNRHNII